MTFTEVYGLHPRRCPSMHDSPVEVGTLLSAGFVVDVAVWCVGVDSVSPLTTGAVLPSLLPEEVDGASLSTPCMPFPELHDTPNTNIHTHTLRMRCKLVIQNSEQVIILFYTTALLNPQIWQVRRRWLIFYNSRSDHSSSHTCSSGELFCKQMFLFVLRCQRFKTGSTLSAITHIMQVSGTVLDQSLEPPRSHLYTSCNKKKTTDEVIYCINVNTVYLAQRECF